MSKTRSKQEESMPPCLELELALKEQVAAPLRLKKRRAAEDGTTSMIQQKSFLNLGLFAAYDGTTITTSKQQEKETLVSSSSSPLVKRRRVSVADFSETCKTKTHGDLPAIVSDAFSSQQAFAPKTEDRLSVLPLENLLETKQSEDDFGWYIDMDDDDNDDDDTNTVVNAYTSAMSQLAFSAATAPKAPVNYNVEVEWAQAADTVDSVLGDLF